MSNLSWSFCRLLIATIWQQQILLIFQLLKNFKIEIIHWKFPRQIKHEIYKNSAYLCCVEAYVSHTCIQSSCHVLKDLQKYFFRNNNTCTFINWCFILKLSNVVKCFPWKLRTIIIVSYNEIPNHGCCLI